MQLLDTITNNGLKLTSYYPQEWVVDCRHVGKGNKELVYLGRYLYRGVIQLKFPRNIKSQVMPPCAEA